MALLERFNSTKFTFIVVGILLVFTNLTLAGPYWFFMNLFALIIPNLFAILGILFIIFGFMYPKEGV